MWVRPLDGFGGDFGESFWRLFGAFGRSFGVMGEGIGRLWGALRAALGSFSGALGRFWDALDSCGETLGGFWKLSGRNS